MRVYGEIETNLKGIYDKYGVDEYYSVDSLLLELEGEYFSIDFEEGDFGLYEAGMSFRLKSLSCTFADSWEKYNINNIKDMENNIELFKNAKLINIVIYLPVVDGVPEKAYEELELKVNEIKIMVGDVELEYKEDIEIELV